MTTSLSCRQLYIRRIRAGLLLLALSPSLIWTMTANSLAGTRLGGDQEAFELFAIELLEQIENSSVARLSDGDASKKALQIAVWPFSDKTAPLPAEIANEYNARLLAELVRRGGSRHRFVAREALGAVVDEVREIHGDEEELDAALSALMESARGDVLIVGKLRLADADVVVVSYRAMGVEDGTIIAATAPRLVSLTTQPQGPTRADRQQVASVKKAVRGEDPLPQRPNESQLEGDPVAAQRSAAPAPDPRVIESVQEDLRALGYDPGPIDGKLGPRTVSAIRAYQANMGAKDDGRITVKLVDNLRRDSAVPGSTREASLEATGRRRAPVEIDLHGPYCREYHRAVFIGGQQSRVYGTACLQPDGSWQIVD